ncbi:hypothetical protein [Microbacterium sp. SLBN-146]|uniref:hypothetical protein n=1 Tax=Microbacterium sp. SLBN-146 TaxID=2768457 RepID=UPI0011536A7B|nr:hypothetical protein [Microbacterium sp. SLBN-146]TQJ31028.1 hypothetical protein FBY39_1487 [Microbacterium sp. SLBN-146]
MEITKRSLRFTGLGASWHTEELDAEEDDVRRRLGMEEREPARKFGELLVRAFLLTREFSRGCLDGSLGDLSFHLRQSEVFTPLNDERRTKPVRILQVRTRVRGSPSWRGVARVRLRWPRPGSPRDSPLVDDDGGVVRERVSEHEASAVGTTHDEAHDLTRTS